MFMRKLRNQVRFLMTDFTGSISILRQFQFWLKTPPEIQPYIALLGSKRVGYLLVKKTGGKFLITEVIDEKYRNLGLGSQLIDHARLIYGNLRAEILKSNTPSISLHSKNGFKFIEEKGGIYCFELN